MSGNREKPRKEVTNQYVGTKRTFDFFVSHPSYAPAQKITQEDVWGKHESSHWKDDLPNTKWIPGRRVSKGMIVASQAKGYPDTCPVWKDKIPYKSVTVICKKKDEEEVKYWLEYVHGAGSISRRKELSKGRVALRSDYKCW